MRCVFLIPSKSIARSVNEYTLHITHTHHSYASKMHMKNCFKLQIIVSCFFMKQLADIYTLDCRTSYIEHSHRYRSNIAKMRLKFFYARHFCFNHTKRVQYSMYNFENEQYTLRFIRSTKSFNTN